jgi:ABC-type antimicrobial peptide transport system permease subunit
MRRRHVVVEWLIDVLAGVLVGGIVGGMVGVNVVIYSGLERGYETTLPEVFEANVVLGIIVVTVLVVFPALGVLMARRRRVRRAST